MTKGPKRPTWRRDRLSMGGNVMRSSSAVATGTRALIGACVVAAVVSMSAAPAWARVRHRVDLTTTTTTGVVLTSTTTTAATMPAPAPPVPAPVDACGKGIWPVEVQGRPLSYQVGDGVYLWDDPDGGWAIRATHSGLDDSAVISGTLTTTTGKFVDVRRAKGVNDIVALSGNKRTILFRFVDYGWVDGFDFATRCAEGFSASFYIGGNLAPTTSIHLGAGATGPPTDPFKVQRGRAAVVSNSLKPVPSLAGPYAAIF
ncbi:MAG TPA: hypothetical protein VMF65_22770 [Acidimicrobiales bacterium]|nr:hypothetical protein [Acidimicrobiales bacterium]